jgi:hypothetical protein
MAGIGPEGEPPRDPRTSSQSQRPEPAEPQQGRPADFSLAPSQPDQRGWQDRSHEELVAGFREAIRQKKQELGEIADSFSPAKIIQSELLEQLQYNVSNPTTPEGRQRLEFFSPIHKAWYVIAYDYYGVGSRDSGSYTRHLAGLELSDYWKRTGQTTITLSEPQRRILEALADAADIPHQKGLTEIPIPEQLSGYADWLREQHKRHGL